MEQTLTSAQAAKSLGISLSYLAHERAAGRGPAYVRLGRAVRYRRCDIEDFQAQSLVVPANQARAGEVAQFPPTQFPPTQFPPRTLAPSSIASKPPGKSSSSARP
jgi:predicted DNA-binding transcriptional regulator AlpA